MVEAFFTAWSIPSRHSKFSVEYSNRMTRCLARTYPERALIRVNARLILARSDLLPVVICHEAAHLAVHYVHGPNASPHGPEWAALVTRAGFEPSHRLRLSDDAAGQAPETKATLQYLHRCPVCQSVRRARRRVARWRCETCLEAGLSGDLTIERDSS